MYMYATESRRIKMSAESNEDFKQATVYLCNNGYQDYEGVLFFSFVIFTFDTISKKIRFILAGFQPGTDLSVKINLITLLHR